jgi:hypothetical protein
MSDDKKVKLQSNDTGGAAKIFEVDPPVAYSSLTIKHMIDDIAGGEIPDDPIPLPNVSSRILEKVVEYCQYHHENPTPPSEKADDKRTDDIIPWDIEFCKVDQPTLFELILVCCNLSRLLSIVDCRLSFVLCCRCCSGCWSKHLSVDLIGGKCAGLLINLLSLYVGCQLPGYQASFGPHLQDRCEHDQGQDPRRNPQDLQHQERLYTRRRGASAQGECLVRGALNHWFPGITHSRSRPLPTYLSYLVLAHR